MGRPGSTQPRGIRALRTLICQQITLAPLENIITHAERRRLCFYAGYLAGAPRACRRALVCWVLMAWNEAPL
jgi:hypothetical protein